MCENECMNELKWVSVLHADSQHSSADYTVDNSEMTGVAEQKRVEEKSIHMTDRLGEYSLSSR